MPKKLYQNVAWLVRFSSSSTYFPPSVLVIFYFLRLKSTKRKKKWNGNKKKKRVYFQSTQHRALKEMSRVTKALPRQWNAKSSFFFSLVTYNITSLVPGYFCVPPMQGDDDNNNDSGSGEGSRFCRNFQAIFFDRFPWSFLPIATKWILIYYEYHDEVQVLWRNKF